MREPNFRGASELPADQADVRRQQEVLKTLKEALPPWVRDGRMVTGSVTDAAAASITHGLKRAIKGWLLFSPSGSADRICLVQTAGDSNTVTLVNTGATGTLSFSLWVF